jgi:tRNA G18 (ribose-2'-O)-methylase SpoU
MNRKLKLWELNRPTVDEFKSAEKFPLVLVLDNIRSLSNVGTFFRTADAFNVEKIYIGGITAQPPHREIQKTALGATESVEWEYVEDIDDLLPQLKAQNYTICSVEQTEETNMLHKINVRQNGKYALIMGNEVEGVQQSLIDASDWIIEVPQFGTKHSLNVSVCAGVVLWEFVRVFSK